MIGVQLGHYRIVEKIGAGAMGVVYRAEDPRLGRQVAVKVLPAAFSADPERLQRFEREARAAGSLNHPALLTIFDVGQHEGSPYLVSELLEGETLRERMKAGPLSPGRAIDYAAQIARGLAASHAKGIVHRDLKPENVFVTREGRLKILDFGLAKLVRPETGGGAPPGPDDSTPTTGLTESGAILGTAGYMSPEQVRGESVDARTDVFALGDMLYEMLSGRRAFQRATAVETLYAVLNEEALDLATIRPEIQPALARICRLCMEKNREERFQSAHDVALALEAIVPGETPPTETTQASRRRRLPVILVAGLASIAVGIAAYLVGAREGKPSPPTFERLTFRRGLVGAARFAADGQTIVYSAAWDGDSLRLFTTRLGSPESSPLNLPVANLASVSGSGELLLQMRPTNYLSFNAWLGTLAQAPLAGGAPREIVENAAAADWSPDGSRVAVVRKVGDRFRLEFPVGKALYESRGYISDPRLSPRADRVAFLDHPVPNDDGGAVCVTDLSGKVRELAAGWSSAAGLAWSPRSDEIWFTAAEKGGSRQLYAVDLEGAKRLLLPVPGGMVLLDVSQRGALLVQENLSYAILGLAPGESRERNLSWLDWSRARDLSTDGRTLLFTEFGEGAGPRFAVCLRKTSGSPVVRLGDGSATALSPDAKWALAMLSSPTPRLQMLPTGAGEPLVFEPGPIVGYQWANWMTDGRRIVLSGYEAEHATRIYIQDVQGGPPRPITPEGTSLYFPCNPVSPDGRFLIAKDAQELPVLFPLEGGAPRPIPGLTSADWPIRWSEDGRFIYVQRSGEIPASVDRLDPRTGRREPWKKLAPSDLAGVIHIAGVRISSDESSYVYGITRKLHDLYLVEGLR